jgi:hypothetical protein
MAESIGLILGLVLTGLVTLLLLGGGAYLTRMGFGVYRQGKRLAAKEPTAVADLTAEQNGAVVTGAARATDDKETVRAPFSGEEAVVSRISVRERRSPRGGGSSDPRWKTIHEEIDAVPFRLEGDTSSVRVTPHKDAQYRFGQETVEESSREDRPARVQEWIDDTGAVPDERQGRRRYNQYVLEVGETAKVSGELRKFAGGVETFELIGGDRADEMVVTDLEENELESRTSREGLLLLAAGVVLVLLSVPLLIVVLFFAFVILL